MKTPKLISPLLKDALLVGLTAVSLSSCPRPASADVYVKPLLGFGPVKGDVSNDVKTIVQHYKGQAVQSFGLASGQGLVMFSVYPDGAARWFRRPLKNLAYNKTVQTELFNGLCNAVEASVPLHFARLDTRRKTRECLLVCRGSGANFSLAITEADTVLRGKYKIEPGRPPAEKLDWSDDLLNQIISKLPKSAVIQGANFSDPCAVWFRLNPDGSIEGCEALKSDKTNSKLRKLELDFGQSMSTAVRKSSPFVWKAPPKPKELNSPRSFLLIYDKSIKGHFKISPVSNSYSLADLSITASLQ